MVAASASHDYSSNVSNHVSTVEVSNVSLLLSDKFCYSDL
jgi:hypothetical protein